MNSRPGRYAPVLLLAASLARAEGWQPPARLRDTGLYADWARKAVAVEVVAYSPQYPLWSDGGVKERFILVPRGTWIDATDPDAWVFPIGTKLWKQFRFDGRRVETRYLERADEGWNYATYAWSADESEAALAPERGIARAVALPGGAWHAIPSRYDCRACHEGREEPVLGFTALQLSPDRDPNAAHGEALRADQVDLRTLVARGLVRGLPARLLDAPPRIPARSANERAALGYLYGNCAMCHNSSGPLASLGLSLDVTLRAGAEAIATAVERPSRYRSPVDGEQVRVSPGHPGDSALVTRMANRGGPAQMPPLGSSLPDDEALRAIRRWIRVDLGSPAAPLRGEPPR